MLDSRRDFEPLSRETIGAAIAVHKALGPGFVESIYQNALCIALSKRHIPYQTQMPVSVSFEGTEVGCHKLDLVVARQIVVELKAVKSLNEVHERQLRSYLKASTLKVGLLLNFNAAVLAIRRIVN
jgi:GxxExxY protein